MIEKDLNIQLGSKDSLKKVTISSVAIDHNCEYSRLTINTKGSDGSRYVITEALVKNHNNVIKTKGLYLNYDSNQDILFTSTLGRVLRHLKIESIPELIGKEVLIAPKSNNFMALVIDK